jgi:CRISPR-associated endonuclease/helicase Cas3
MRTLVEQTRDSVKVWLERLNLLRDDKCEHSGKVRLHILMGGEDDGNWDLYPEREAILIGTQDMLLSRALNRGYGMSRYRWPMHFGLLNNDCLWVYDEVQLMGSGVPTTAQLESFRRTMNPAANCHSFWMSATLKPDWLKTVDFEPQRLGRSIELSAADLNNADLRCRHSATKPVSKAEHLTTATKGLAQEVYAAACAADGLTLVIVNIVQRARDLHSAIEKLARKEGAQLAAVLIHSRFRPPDRAQRLAKLLASGGRKGIVVSTQVVEAGVDVSAQILFTEIAPWASLVQRFGRCNRGGEFADRAQIHWIDLDEDKLSPPYEPEQLLEARQRLEELRNAGPVMLAEFNLAESDKPHAAHIIRRKDFVELFDTTPDLAGNDIDIDRYIRDAEDCMVQVFWRSWEQKFKAQPPAAKTPAAAAPARNELCPVPIKNFREFLQGETAAFVWDFLERQWQKADPQRLVPGQNYLLHVSAGGYSIDTGWNTESSAEVADLRRTEEGDLPEDNDSDILSERAWDSIAGHTEKVVSAL